MATGLIALLDDVAAIAKVAAASLDDVAAGAAKASAKAAGVVIDDAAVTPRYVVGFTADREIPIVKKIAVGSLRNKLVFLLPAALLLSMLAPWAITPLLMLGGAYLCFEGAEKVMEALGLAAHHDAAAAPTATDPRALEDQKVTGAIRTDFILSAEIMAIALGTIPEMGFWSQAVVLAVVGVGITALVYGAVALIVRADDLGMALAKGSTGGGGPGMRALGRAIVRGMPAFLKVLSTVGTAAMLWVGGQLILHGMEGYGLSAIPHGIHLAAEGAAHAMPALAGTVEWIVSAALAGVFGLLLGAALAFAIGLVRRFTG
ncbi:DUF808 domain-containing protein [Roseococcus sp. YIM B11640]|uniref:DUF808 domain-containing protein n=1 Tax=Roseococcus sp. YIM B11640 TaxID=3133973 RepID=UPI003C7CC059